MRIFKDNYFESVKKNLKPFASVLAVLVSLALFTGFLIAFTATGSGSDLFLCAVLMLALVLFYPFAVKMSNGSLWGRMAARMGAILGKPENAHLRGAVKFPTKKQNVYLQQALNVGGMTPLGGAVPFPFGDGYLTLFLDITINVVIGTGTGAISEGELLFIKNLYLRTDKHGAIIDNVCGRALYRRAQKVMQTAPYKDAIAATTGAYVISIPIHFANPKNRRKQDTILDMAGVKSMDLQITLGSASDLYTSPGTAAITCAVDISVEKTLVPLDSGNAPVRQPYLAPINPLDPSVLQNIELPKITDLGINDIMLLTSNSASAGVPWSGTPTANVIKRFTFEDNIRKIFDQVPVSTMRNDNKLKFQLETMPTGIFIIDFTEEESIWQGYSVGGKAKVNLNWINDTLSTSQISGLIDGTLSLKAAA